MIAPADRGPRPWRSIPALNRGTARGTAALVIVFAAAAVFRLAVVGSQSLWADEVFSLALATGHSLEHPAAAAEPDLGDFVESPGPEPPAFYSRYLDNESPPAGPGRVIRAVLRSDTSPPLYYVLLASWARLFGTSDRALRLFSVLASLLGLALLALLGRRAGGRSTVLPAATLFAVSPMAVYYSTEGRMYALLWLWVIALLVLTLQLRLRGSHPPLLAAWVLVGAAGLLTHYFFVSVWLVAAGWLLVHAGRCRRGPLAIALALTVALVVPWYAHLPQAFGQWRVTGDWLKLMPKGGYDPILTPLRLPRSLLSLRIAEGVPWPLAALNTAALVVVFALAVRRFGRRLLTPRRRLLWLAFLAGVGTPVVLDLVLGTFMSAVPRYALAALPSALVLLAVMLTALRPPRRTLVTALIVVLALAGTWRVQRAWARSGEPLDALGRFLAAEAGASDLVVVHSIPSGVCGVARYMALSGSADGAPVAAWVGQLKRREVPRDIGRLADGRRRILLVDIHVVGDELPPAVWLQAGARLTSTRVFDAATVRVFERGEGAPAGPGGPCEGCALRTHDVPDP
jgi:hypothetical protein